MTDTAQVERDAKEFQRELILQLQRSPHDMIAAVSFVHAMLAQQSVEALLQLLKHKGLITDTEINKALSDSYHAGAHRLRNSGAAVFSAPMVRPNGSF